tara:strand:- start:612 stop:1361 length:750 start_codon:yes stop_codon:yes gene_type:complete
MITAELFSGTGSFSKIALEKGCDVHTYDICPRAKVFEGHPHESRSVMDKDIKLPNLEEGILWASVPCTAFSVAAMGKNWHKPESKNETRRPKSESAIEGLKLLERTLQLIVESKPAAWFIENPRGMMRKVMPELLKKYNINAVRRTITYCSYLDGGEKYPVMKPTDIWTNSPWKPRPACKNYKYDKDGNIIDRHCHHESARRGSVSGVQGIKGARDRSRVPSELFEEIFTQITEPYYLIQLSDYMEGSE